MYFILLISPNGKLTVSTLFHDAGQINIYKE